MASALVNPGQSSSGPMSSADIADPGERADFTATWSQRGPHWVPRTDPLPRALSQLSGDAQGSWPANARPGFSRLDVGLRALFLGQQQPGRVCRGTGRPTARGIKLGHCPLHFLLAGVHGGRASARASSDRACLPSPAGSVEPGLGRSARRLAQCIRTRESSCIREPRPGGRSQMAPLTPTQRCSGTLCTRRRGRGPRVKAAPSRQDLPGSPSPVRHGRSLTCRPGSHQAGRCACASPDRLHGAATLSPVPRVHSLHLAHNFPPPGRAASLVSARRTPYSSLSVRRSSPPKPSFPLPPSRTRQPRSWATGSYRTRSEAPEDGSHPPRRLLEGLANASLRGSAPRPVLGGKTLPSLRFQKHPQWAGPRGAQVSVAFPVRTYRRADWAWETPTGAPSWLPPGSRTPTSWLPPPRLPRPHVLATPPAPAPPHPGTSLAPAPPHPTHPHPVVHSARLGDESSPTAPCLLRTAWPTPLSVFA